ncbi:branched-chain amino acid ABC transporter permease [Actinomadura sp. 1N219]|uniref:branched-chain amino acid ABC transporter permease n=1 Tax=Actinomadura sp. 1N219 TaxID=3375152 RepID=UPI003797BFDC
MKPFALLLAATALLPLLFGPYWVGVAFLALVYAGAASAWNIAGGFAGASSFGQGLFFGVGGYSAALLFDRLGITAWLGLLVGALLGGLLGAGIGWLGSRLKIGGLAFAVLTLALAEIAFLFVQSFEPVGASRGIDIPPSDHAFADMQFSSPTSWLAVGAGYLICCQLVATGINRSALGHRFRAVRENPLAAEAMGVSATASRVIALGISGALTAIAGTIFAQYSVFINPSLFGPQLTIEVILFSLVGGMGTVWGPVLGTVILYPLGTWLRTEVGGTVPGVDLLLYGVLVIICIRTFPGGLVRFNPHHHIRRLHPHRRPHSGPSTT